MKNKRVLILIEHVARELECAVLIKSFFEKKNYLVEIKSIKFIKEKVVLESKADIIIVPWAYNDYDINLFRSFKKQNNKVIIINMHHEQLSNKNSDAFILPKGDAKKVLHLSWGKEFTEKLIQCGCDSKTIIQCGNPRLDFYKKNMINISKNKKILSEKYGLDINKKWILFIANSFHLLNEDQININLSKGVDIEDQIKSSIINRNEFLNYVEQYLNINDDVEIIYRPHPSFAHEEEKREEILKLKNSFKAFKCISKESVRDWIINSDKIISFHSTSVIECCVANKEFYLIRSENLSREKDYKFFYDYKYKIKKYNDFVNIIKNEIDFCYDNFIENIKCDLDLNLDIYSAEKLVEELDYMFRNIKKYETKIDFRKSDHFRNIIKCKLKLILKNILKNKRVRRYFLSKNDIRFFNLLYKGDDYFDNNNIRDIQKLIERELYEQ